MVIDADALPVADEVRRWHQREGSDVAAAALQAGDDYELLFTVRPAHQRRLRGVERTVGDLPIRRIGMVTRERRLLVRTAEGHRELPEGFEHFR